MTEKLFTTGFEQQFQNTKTVESYGGTAKYLSIKPEFSNSDVPVLMAPGWSEGFGAFHDSAEELYENGRHVLLVEHTRTGGSPEELGFEREVEHKANTLLEVLDDAGVERADVIAHSEGALNTIVAAFKRPEKFRNVILAMPAGMIGKDSVLKLAGRFAPKMARSLTKDTFENPQIGTAINIGGAAYIAKNPAKAMREVSAMAETTIDDVVGVLREQGVHVGVLQSNADTVFPPDRIEQSVRLEDPFANVDAYASVAAKDAGHDDLLIHPERATNGALQMLAQFE